MNYLKLTTDKLDINLVNDLVSHESCGAVSLFVGTTRDNFEEKTVLSLEYEAYEPMAIKSMTKICDNMRNCWNDIVNIGIYHRLGLVPVKEASVIIAVSSPHRKTSLEAVQYAIEELKKSVPVWKKEFYSEPSGSSEWKENKESCTQERPNHHNNHNNNKKRKFGKLSLINFDDCQLLDVNIPKNLIQINADEVEVNRRVNCFVERKREEIDINNIHDFIENKSTELNEDEITCARVNSVCYKKKDSKGHLGVDRVANEYGPQQTQTNYKNALDKLMDYNFSPKKLKSEFINDNNNFDNKPLTNGVVERLDNAEKYLNINNNNTPVSKNIYERLKRIENRILYLETISPEYSHFLEKQPQTNKYTKIVHTTNDLDSYIEELEAILQKNRN